MATTELVLPTDEKVRLVYLRKWPDLGDMIYLQSIRSGRLQEDSSIAQTYRAMAPFHAFKLAGLLLGEEGQFDAVVSPPSTRSDSSVYREAFTKRANVWDLASGFSRKGLVRAATASSVEEVANEFIYVPTGRESQIRSLLIVDESIATGKSVAAVLAHLRAAGLPNGSVTVAAAAWLVRNKPDAEGGAQ